MPFFAVDEVDRKKALWATPLVKFWFLLKAGGSPLPARRERVRMVRFKRKFLNYGTHVRHYGGLSSPQVAKVLEFDRVMFPSVTFAAVSNDSNYAVGTYCATNPHGKHDRDPCFLH